MKTLRIFFAVLLTTATLSHSRPSQAAVGAAVSTPVLIAGIVISGATGIGILRALKDCRGDNSGLCAGLVVIVGGPLLIAGLIVLDGEQGVAFRELSEAQASKLGVSSSELAVYNSELDEANAIMADVEEELSSKKKPTGEDSKAAWNNVKDMVSPETFSTMQKIVSQQ